MTFTSSLFFVLALSFTSASIQQGTTEEELIEQIASVVVDKLIQVANNASTDNNSEAELDAKLLDTILDILDQEMEPEMEALRYVSNDSPDQIAENLALKITQNALPEDGKIAPRGFVGSFFKVGGKVALKVLIKALLDKVTDSQDDS